VVEENQGDESMETGDPGLPGMHGHGG